MAFFVLSPKSLQKEETCFFDLCQYTIEAKNDLTQIPTANICAVIEKIRAEDTKNSVLDSLRKLELEGNVSAGWGGKISLGGKIGHLQEFIIDALYSIRRLAELKNKKVVIYVEGFADGQQSTWHHTLLPGKYHYTTMNVFPLADPSDAFVTLEYLPEEKSWSVADVNKTDYCNADLPNLRAYFVQERFLKPFLQGNEAKIGQWEIHILQGQVFSRPNQPLKRKVQIFVGLY